MESENELYSPFSDELRIQGIYHKGYGTIPKLAMLDHELTIEAKAIYAYFCSYSGSGNAIFPGRERILDDLGISKSCYYRHYNQLIELGFLEVKQNKTQGNMFLNNVYTLVASPARLKEKIASTEGNTSQLRKTGILSGGYGLVPKAIMIDKRLSLKAKGLYAYYAAFTGSGSSAFPEKAVILSHLNIGVHTYENCNRELIDLNYIIVRQRHVNGRLSVNDVFLTDHPNNNYSYNRNEVITIQSSKIQDTDSFLHSRKQDTEKKDSENQDTGIQDTNSSQKQQKQFLFINPSAISQEDEDRLVLIHEKRKNFSKRLGRENEYKHYTKGEDICHDLAMIVLLDYGKIPEAWLEGSNDRMRGAIDILLEDEIFGSKESYARFEDGERQFQIYCLFKGTLLKMLGANKEMQISGDTVTARDVLARIQDLIYVDRVNYLFSLDELQSTVCENYKMASHQFEIKNPERYMQSVIWNALKYGKLND